jgi:hypothetical protein
MAQQTPSQLKLKYPTKLKEHYCNESYINLKDYLVQSIDFLNNF